MITFSFAVNLAIAANYRLTSQSSQLLFYLPDINGLFLQGEYKIGGQNGRRLTGQCRKSGSCYELFNGDDMNIAVVGLEVNAITATVDITTALNVTVVILLDHERKVGINPVSVSAVSRYP